MKRIIILITILLAGIQNNNAQVYLKNDGVRNLYRSGKLLTTERLILQNVIREKGSGYVQFKRWEYNAKRLMNEAGYLPRTEAILAEN